MRKGDEISEMRNVINTMMRLWSVFLIKTGKLLSEVLKTNQDSSHPSLDDISKRLEQMAKLTSFSRDIRGVASKEEVYNQLRYIFEHTFLLKYFIMFEVNSSDNRMTPAFDSQPELSLCKANVMLNPELCRAKRMSEEISSVNNPILCPYFNCDHSKYYRFCIPQIMGGQTGNVFSFMIPKMELKKYTDQIIIIRKYLEELAPILTTLRLIDASKDQAMRDPLTHSHNRRFLNEYIEQYEPLAKREKQTIGFIMADLDFFKQVNDKYGHQAGDSVLKELVAVMKREIRSSDLLVRYGGEEFLLIFPNVQENYSEILAEKIRTSVEKTEITLPNGEKIYKTVSIGVAEYPKNGDSFYKTIKFADVALYEAKKTGRNRTVRFTPDLWTEESY